MVGNWNEANLAQGDLTVTHAVEGPRAPVLLRRFQLSVVEGPDADKRHTPRADRTVVGSHESADLVLQDETVSRFHCEIELAADDRIVIRDLGSKNGTRVNGVLVMQAQLQGGEILTLGRTRLKFDFENEHIEVPLSPRSEFGRLVGQSRAMRAVFALLERAAASDTTLLLQGETGTGKEAAAESIHLESARKDNPFVIVDCAAIPANLLESELFGHEKGAFTGAIAQRQGAFEAASTGTIFLDEIGELGLELQPKLLRALERKQIKRVGSSQYASMDVRVIAATNRDLRAEVNAGRFRSDLYYRLAVVQVRMPPLRDRTEDLPILLERILADTGAAKRPEAALTRTPEFLARLAAHPWPGNIREMRNLIERFLFLGGLSYPEDEPTSASSPSIDTSQPFRAAREAWVRVFERKYVEDVLARHGNNVSSAARAAELDRMSFYRLLRRSGHR